jgi:two-component sensor histidine kinase
MDILFSFDAEALVTAEQAAAIGAMASEALINSIKYSSSGRSGWCRQRWLQKNEMHRACRRD